MFLGLNVHPYRKLRGQSPTQLVSDMVDERGMPTFRESEVSSTGYAGEPRRRFETSPLEKIKQNICRKFRMWRVASSL